MRTSDRNRRLTDKDQDSFCEEHDRACKRFLDYRNAVLFWASLCEPKLAEIIRVGFIRNDRWLCDEVEFKAHTESLGLLVVDLERPLYAKRMSLPVCWADVWIEFRGVPIVVEVKTEVRRGRLGEALRQCKLYRELANTKVALFVERGDAWEYRGDAIADDDRDAFERLGFPVVLRWDHVMSGIIARDAVNGGENG